MYCSRVSELAVALYRVSFKGARKGPLDILWGPPGHFVGPPWTFCGAPLDILWGPLDILCPPPP